MQTMPSRTSAYSFSSMLPSVLLHGLLFPLPRLSGLWIGDNRENSKFHLLTHSRLFTSLWKRNNNGLRFFLFKAITTVHCSNKIIFLCIGEICHLFYNQRHVPAVTLEEIFALPFFLKISNSINFCVINTYSQGCSGAGTRGNGVPTLFHVFMSIH